MKYTNAFQIVAVILLLQLIGCKQQSTPKPSGYFRIDFPDKNYQRSELDYPYQFEYPNYSTLAPDNSKFTEPYWLNINTPIFESNLYISYKTVNNDLSLLTEDSRELAYKHSIKATAINEKIFINNKDRVFGTIYEIKGNAASPFQFYLTDSTNHFLRGSLYINEVPNYDSLYPVIQFLEEDIYHLIESLTWK